MLGVVGALRLAANTPRLLPKTHSLVSIRNHGHWNYRTAPPLPPKRDVWYASFVGGVMWWWILWHFWHESGHVFGGEWPIVDQSKWTDEELGVPPDSEGLGGRTPIPL